MHECVIIRQMDVDPDTGVVKRDLRGFMGVWFKGISSPLVIPSGLHSLRTLRIHNCQRISLIPEDIVHTIECIDLHVVEYTSLPHRMDRLHVLRCDFCPKLEDLPVHTPRLDSLIIHHSPRIRGLPETLDVLTELCISGPYNPTLDLRRTDTPKLKILDLRMRAPYRTIHIIPVSETVSTFGGEFVNGICLLDVYAEARRRPMEKWIVRIVHRMGERRPMMQMDGVRMLKDFLY